LKLYLLKLYRQLKGHKSLVLLGEVHTQKLKILNIAAKLIKYNIIQFQDNKEMIVKKLRSMIIYSSNNNNNNNNNNNKINNSQNNSNV
jgi:hypothetical protein